MLIKSALFLLLSFSGFFTVKIGISPIYLTSALASYFLLVNLFSGRCCIVAGSPVVICALFIIYLFVGFVFAWGVERELQSAYLNLVFSLVYFILSTTAIGLSSRRNVISATKAFYYVSSCILIIELVYRFAHPEAPDEWVGVNYEDIYWYVYKTSSFMYPDSNWVGLFVSCLILFILGLPRLVRKEFIKFLIPMVVFLIGSLSRAAILAVMITPGSQNSCRLSVI